MISPNNIENLILHRRTIRKFQKKPVTKDILLSLVNCARMHASGGNLQPVRYAVISKKDTCDKIFPLLKWAAYLPDFDIKETERPTAYLILYSDERVRKSCGFDIGAAATNIMLMAEAYGLGSCCIGSFTSAALNEVMNIDPSLKAELIIALGYPAQQSQSIISVNGEVRYTEDQNGNISVPKHSLETVLISSDV